MASRSSLEQQLDHIKDMCKQLGDEELVKFVADVPTVDLMATWKALLLVQDNIRNKIYTGQHQQLSIYRKLAALMILNKYVAITIGHELHGKIPREAVTSMLKKRHRPHPKLVDSSSSEEGVETSSGEEDIVFCASKRQRSD